MDTKRVTDQIMSAWDELEAEEAAEPEAEAEEVVEAGEEPEEAIEAPDDGEEEEAEEAEEEEEAEGEDEGEEESDEEAEEAEPEEPDPEVRAFLAKYNGDVDEALKGAAELQRVLGRQGQEKGQLARRVEELETELQRMQHFSGVSPAVNPEQREWIEEAVGSGNPGAYVNGALQAGEFGLARLVCQEWAREDPFQALRAAQVVDGAEQQAQVVPEFDGPVDTGILLNVLSDNYPDMRNFEPEMISTLTKLGPGHPLVQDAQSGELERAARGIVGIYEIARASSTSVRAARDGVKRKQRQAGDDARQAAQVSSGSASPSKNETPRPVRLGPGLTLEDLEAEFARQ